MHEALDVGQWVLFESAQATYLDLDHGTYPFVTSSNPVAGGVGAGAGVGPRAIERITGIVKAYVTRVGSGPFPTELFEGDEVGDLLVERGQEFGTNTGRKRRAGWLDLVMLKHATRLNTCTELAITKLDVLSPLPELKVCVAYEDESGTRYDHVPYHQSVLHKVKPIYETLPGWQVEVERAERIEDLPPAARDYVRFIEKFTGVHVSFVSVGPARPDRRAAPRRVNVLVVGSGGREHALMWALARSPVVDSVVAAPGNPGMSELGPCLDLERAVERLDAFDLVVIGPEAPLVDGLADDLRASGAAVFGPSAAAARLEGSKAWMKEVLADAGVPSARHAAFDATQETEALAFLETLPGFYVVKTDGLAAGKGVVVTESHRRGARRRAGVPLGGGVRRCRPHARDRRGAERPRGVAARAVRRLDRGRAPRARPGLQADRRR